MMKKMITMVICLILVCVSSSCEKLSQDMTESQSLESKSSYLTDTFTPELYDILFEKEPYEYDVKYHADYDLTTIDGQQDLIFIESFFVYERDESGELIKCKTVMVTERELNQVYMEDYLLDAYGEKYEYTKPYNNVYVHIEDIPH